jgi:hypothetical protein
MRNFTRRAIAAARHKVTVAYYNIVAVHRKAAAMQHPTICELTNSVSFMPADD